MKFQLTLLLLILCLLTDAAKRKGRAGNFKSSGIKASKIGDLVGIVVVGSTPYFIWRKTDEVFTERFVQV